MTDAVQWFLIAALGAVSVLLFMLVDNLNDKMDLLNARLTVLSELLKDDE